jgi:hypothetical protein
MMADIAPAIVFILLGRFGAFDCLEIILKQRTKRDIDVRPATLSSLLYGSGVADLSHG